MPQNKRRLAAPADDHQSESQSPLHSPKDDPALGHAVHQQAVQPVPPGELCVPGDSGNAERVRQKLLRAQDGEPQGARGGRHVGRATIGRAQGVIGAECYDSAVESNFLFLKWIFGVYICYFLLFLALLREFSLIFGMFKNIFDFLEN